MFPKGISPAYSLSLPSKPFLNSEGLTGLQELPCYSKLTKLLPGELMIGLL